MSNRLYKITVTFFIIGLFIVAWSACTYVETHYKMKANVTYVEKDCVYVTDTTDNVYGFYSTSEDDYKVGDSVVLTMDTNLTDNDRTDDIITKVKGQ